MSGAHHLDDPTEGTIGDADSPPVLDYGREGDAPESHASTREKVEFGLMGLVYFLLPLLLLFVMQVVLG